jgi:hypothetical protein
MAGLIAIVAVVAVLISVGVVYKEEKPSDSEYFEWEAEISNLESTHMDLFIDATGPESVDFAGVVRYAGMLYDDANKALNEIDRFSVSPGFQPSKDEFKLGQEDLKRAGYYIERGARNYNVDDTETGYEYLKSYFEHVTRSNLLHSDYIMHGKH